MQELYRVDPPHSPTFYMTQIDRLHSLIHGHFWVRSSESPQEREKWKTDLMEFIECSYEQSATYESPLTAVVTRAQIAATFLLGQYFPGTIWGELGDVCEAQIFDGVRIVVFSHTLHYSIFRSMADQPVFPPEHEQAERRIGRRASIHRPGMWHRNPGMLYSAGPVTPYTEVDSLDMDWTSPSSRLTSFRSFPPLSSNVVRPSLNADGERNIRTPTSWPLTMLFFQLAPRSILKTCTTAAITVHTKLVFNENGKIIYHEDVVGVRDFIEAIPVAGFVYKLGRWFFGNTIAGASRWMFGTREVIRQPSEEEILGYHLQNDPDGYSTDSPSMAASSHAFRLLSTQLKGQDGLQVPSPPASIADSDRASTSRYSGNENPRYRRTSGMVKKRNMLGDMDIDNM